MTFAQSSSEWLVLALTLLCTCVVCIYSLIKAQQRFAQSPLTRVRSYRFTWMSFGLQMMCIGSSVLLMAIAILGPRWGTIQDVMQTRGIDIIVALDVSKSMRALDLGNGQQTRLMLSKAMIEKFVRSHTQHRYSLVIFAGEAFVTTPLTLDHNTFIAQLQSVQDSDVATQGTNLSEALRTSIARFIDHSIDNEQRGKAIILMSDGGENVDTTGLQQLAAIAQENNITILTIGIGTKEGALIPDGQDVFGRLVYKTFQGEQVRTSLNEAPLQAIAEETEGVYFRAESVDDLIQINQEIDALQTTLLEKVQDEQQEERYQWFLLPGLIFFLLWIFWNRYSLRNT